MMEKISSKPKKRVVKNEVLQVRIDPFGRHVVEVAAKLCNQTVSSYIGTALKQRLKDLHIPDPDDEDEVLDIHYLCKETYDRDDSKKFVKKAQNAHFLLSEDEKIKWEFIQSEPCFWIFTGESRKRVNIDLIKASWDLLDDLENGEIDRKALLALISQQLRTLKINEKKRKECIKLLKEIWTEAEGGE